MATVETWAIRTIDPIINNTASKEWRYLGLRQRGKLFSRFGSNALLFATKHSAQRYHSWLLSSNTDYDIASLKWIIEDKFGSFSSTITNDWVVSTTGKNQKFVRLLGDSSWGTQVFGDKPVTFAREKDAQRFIYWHANRPDVKTQRQWW